MMDFKIIGLYTIRIPVTTMFLNTEIEITRKNLITTLGESFFLNRCIGDSYDPIEYICIGDASNIPQKSDEQLGHETLRQTCVKTVDLNNKRVVLTTTFSVQQIVGTTEIGVANDKILISHDVFNKITDEILTNSVGYVELEYSFQLSTSAIRNGWIKHPNYNDVFYIYEPNTVIGVFENNTGNGYKRVGDLIEVERTVGSYWHDISGNHNLYIHSITTNREKIDDDEVLIQIK